MSTSNGYMSSWFSDAAGKELFREASSAWAGGILFGGQAVRSDGGYRVSGRWPFASACYQAEVFGLPFSVIDSNGDRVIRPEGFAEQAIETITIFGSSGFTEPGGVMNLQLGASLTVAWWMAFAAWGGLRGHQLNLVA